MGIPAWLWFVIAVIAALAGVYVLYTDRNRRMAWTQERRRWAGLRGWRFAESESDLGSSWNRGPFAADPESSVAKRAVTGSMFTGEGRRPLYVFDLEQGRKLTTTVAAVRCSQELGTVVEMWRPERATPAELEVLGQIGGRAAVAGDVELGRSLVTADLAEIVSEIGEDVAVVWLEKDWVLASAPLSADPERLEQVLRDLGDAADVVDPLQEDVTDNT